MTAPRGQRPRSPLPAATGIVLAGGRSRRFGSDKLAFPIAGRPMIEHAVIALADVCRDVLVVVRPVGDPPPLPRRAAGRRIVVVRDPEPFGGPLVGLLPGLERAVQPIVIVAAGDMPTLQPAVLALLVNRLGLGDWDAASLVLRGRRQAFPSAFRVGTATHAVRNALGAGERRYEALFATLRTLEVAEAEWRPLDPDGATVRDIDRRADLPPA